MSSRRDRALLALAALETRAERGEALTGQVLLQVLAEQGFEEETLFEAYRELSLVLVSQGYQIKVPQPELPIDQGEPAPEGRGQALGCLLLLAFALVVLLPAAWLLDKVV